MEIHRGPLVENYDNGPAGLGQRFTLHDRPGGEEGRVAVELGLDSEGLLVMVARGGGAVAFLRPGEELGALRLGGATAVDAAGRALQVRLELDGGTLRLAVADRQAVYPVTVELLATSSAWTSAQDLPNLVALLVLSPVVGAATADYFAQMRAVP